MAEESGEVTEVIQTTEDILKNYTRDQLAQIVLSWNRHKEILHAGQKKYKQKPEVIERMRIKNAELYAKKHGITEAMRKLKLEKKTLAQAEKTLDMIKLNLPEQTETIQKAMDNIALVKQRIAEMTAEMEESKSS
jgi:hypothetical protein